MSVAITAQVPIESFATPSPASASPQAGQGTGATTEQGLVDFFAKARLDAGQTADAINSVASSGAMLGKLREFIDKAHQVDAKNHATRVKQKAAAAQANIDLATMDTLGSLSQFRSLGQSGSLAQSGLVGQFTSLNRFASVGRHPGPASASLGPGPGLEGPDVASPGRLSAMADKMTNDLMDSAIYNMWTQVVVHGTTQVTKSVMTLLKGQ
jgi:hypothetical protein